MLISVIVPSYHEWEDDSLFRCLQSVKTAIFYCPCGVEVCIAEDIKGIGKARNTGALKTTGDILVFMDADCTMSKNFLKEVYEKSLDPKNLGGGVKYSRFDKFSLGRLCFALYVGLLLYIRRITLGAFWIRRETFMAIHGFRERLEHLDGHVIYYDEMLDFDFALRLKQYAESQGCRFRSIKKSYIIWSTRSFTKYGDWFWLKQYKLYRD